MRITRISPNGNYESELGVNTWGTVTFLAFLTLALQMFCLEFGLVVLHRLTLPLLDSCFVLGAGLWVWAQSRHSIRFIDLRCGRCGYSLQGLAHTVCPECGHNGVAEPYPTHRFRNPMARRAAVYGLMLQVLPSLVMLAKVEW
jgi:hypothetical protein